MSACITLYRVEHVQPLFSGSPKHFKVYKDPLHLFQAYNAQRSSVQVIRCIVEELQTQTTEVDQPDLMRILFDACHHPNRFVRETDYHILAAIVANCSPPTLSEIGADVARSLEDGLSENWSQVTPFMHRVYSGEECDCSVGHSGSSLCAFSSAANSK